MGSHLDEWLEVKRHELSAILGDDSDPWIGDFIFAAQPSVRTSHRARLLVRNKPPAFVGEFLDLNQ